VLSGRGLCDELVTRPEESPTECGVSKKCDCEASKNEAAKAPQGAVEQLEKKITILK
jgi:hypothetical protein